MAHLLSYEFSKLIKKSVKDQFFELYENDEIFDTVSQDYQLEWLAALVICFVYINKQFCECTQSTHISLFDSTLANPAEVENKYLVLRSIFDNKGNQTYEGLLANPIYRVIGHAAQHMFDNEFNIVRNTILASDLTAFSTELSQICATYQESLTYNTNTHTSSSAKGNLQTVIVLAIIILFMCGAIAWVTDCIGNVRNYYQEKHERNQIPAVVEYEVYWVPNGKSYHYFLSCPTLSRSTEVFSGSLQEALIDGKDDPCDICTDE